MKMLRRYRTSIGAFMTTLVAIWQICSPVNLSAATFYWDNDTTAANNSVTGTNLGGTGTWDTTASVWWAPLAGADVAWSNAGNDTAVFTGTAGTVTTGVGAPVSAGALVFNTTGYTLAGAAADTITLAGSAPFITMAPGILSTTISANLAGTNGFIFNGSAGGTTTLSYAGTESLTGTIKLNSGQITVNANTTALNSGVNLTFGGTGQFNYNNTSAGSSRSQSLGTLTFAAGDGTVMPVRPTAQPLFLTFSSLGARAEGATGNLVVAGGGGVTGTDIALTITAQASGFMGPGYFTGTASAGPYGSYAFYDTSFANDSVRALSYTTDSGAATIGAGATLGAATGMNMQMTGAISAQTTNNINTLKISGANNLTLAGGATLTFGGTGAGGILKAGNNAATISGGTGITAGTAGGQELIIRTDQASDALTISSSILSSTGALTKSGLGTLTLTNTSNAYTGTTYINDGTLVAQGGTGTLGASGAIVLNGGTNQNTATIGTLSIKDNGNGLGSLQTLNYGQDVTVNSHGGITAGNISGTIAINKTVQFDTLTIAGSQSFTATVANGYGIRFNGATSFSGPAGSSAYFNVAGTQAANIVQGLALGDIVSGSGVNLVKQGTGTLVLENSGNTFGGTNALLDIQAGVLQVNNEGSMGHSGNVIALNGGTLRANYSTGVTPSTRAYYLGANSTIAVTSGNVFEIANSLTVPVLATTLSTTEKGILVLNDNGTAWTGAITVGGSGALRVKHNNSLGSSVTGATTVSSGAALQLDGSAGSLTVAEAISINGTGINSSGALQNFAGTNAVTGTVTLASAAMIGANAGSTLNLDNATAVTGAFALTLSGAGNININGSTGTVTGITQIRGTPTSGPITTVGAASGLTGTISITGGTFIVGNAGGVGTLGTPGAAATNTISAGSVLTINDAGAVVANRLGGGNRNITLTASRLNYIGNGSAASNETLGILTAAAGQDLVSVTGGTLGNAATLTFSSLASNIVNVGGFLNLQGINGNNSVVFTTAPTLVGGVIQRAALNGTDLVTATAATPVSVATYTGVSGDINNHTLAPAGTTAATANAELSSGTHQIAPGTTVNSVVMHSGTASTLSGTAGSALTITSGNILVSGSSGNVIGNASSPNNGIILAQGSVPSAIMVNTGSSLELAATITTNANTGLQKALGGSLDITGKQYFNTGTGFFDINGGTVKLSAGDHTLAPLSVNLALDPTATLDLNGSTLTANALVSSGLSVIAGSGGTVTNTSGSQATLVIRSTSASFGGQITGNVFVGLGAAVTFSNDNTYTGGTLLTGGSSILRDYGKLSSATGNIDINYAGLFLLNDGLTDDFDRLNDAKDITLRGGTLSFKGRSAVNSSETVGDVTLAQGTSLIGAAHGSNNIALLSEAELTLSSLTRNAGAGATVAFTQQFYTGSGGGTSGGILGSIGTSERILVTGGVPLTNNIIGPWALAVQHFNTQHVEFASYNTSFGVGKLNTTGLAGYDGTAFPVSDQPTQNIRVTAGGTVTTGGVILNSLNLASNQVGAVALNFAGASDVLNLRSGGLIVQNAIATAGATSIGAIGTAGILTAGGTNPGALSDLYLYYYANNSASALTVNSQITNNPTDNSAVRLILWGGIWASNANTILANGTNNYTGGTVVNQSTLTIGATGNLPTGGLTINGGAVAQTAGGVIGTQAVALNGSSTLTLVGNNTLTSLTFDNNGGTTAPTVTSGGVLSLTGTISASSSNPNTTATVAGTVDFGGAAKTITADAAIINGEDVAPWTPSLNISAAIQNAGLLTKDGSGVLQLSSTASTFTGGVNLTSGGLMIGASSTSSARTFPNIQPTVTSGPLGTGTLSISGGTRLLSSAANTVANQLVIGGNFEFDGINNLTLNGDTDLGSATRTISVNTPQMTATLGGIISGTGAGGIIKNGYGTLVLGNANTFSGGVTLNNGTLIGTVPFSANASGSPFGSGSITYNGGVLSLRSASDAVFGNDINVNTSLGYVNLDVQGTSGPNTIKMGNFNLPTTALNPTVAQVNITGGSAANPSTLVVTTNSLGLNNGATSGSRVAGQFQTFNIAANTTLAITSGGFERNNEPLNIGAGTLLLGGSNNFTDGTSVTTSNTGAAPVTGAVSAVYGTGQTVTLNGTGLVYTIAPQMGAVTVGAIAGATTGGLQQTFANVGAGNLNVAANWGNGPGSVFNGVQPNDSGADRVLYVNPNSGLVVYNGYLNITTGGTYSFIVGSDDNSSLVIDGVEVARDIGGGHGVQDTARGSIALTAGQHTITMKINVGGGQAGGGSRLLYSGPDTATAAGNNGYQAIPSSALSYFSGPANPGNNYYNAAQIDNDYVLSAASTATLQGLGTDFNSTLKTLTLGNASTLSVTNDLTTIGVGGTGFIGVIGTTTVGTGVTLNPTTGNLYLIGGISDGGNGLTKTGAGTLSLNNSASFTGALAINAGTVRIFESNALSTGGTTVATGASLDLNGTASSPGRNVTINGAGTISQFGALYNSSANAGSLAGSLTLATASTIAGYGDMIVSGAITSSALLTKSGPNTLTLSGNNSTMTGSLTIAGGVVNNGTLNDGVTTNQLGGGAGMVTINAGTALNLNGNNTDRAITTNGTSISNQGPNQNTLGSIINSSISSSFSLPAPPAPGSAFMKQANTANTATLSGNVTMNAALGIGSNTFASGGDIIGTGIFSGGQALTKVGGNTFILRGANTYSGGTNVNYGVLKLDNAGTIQGAGGILTVQTGASLILDNATTAVSNRLNTGGVVAAANNKNLVLNGGTFSILGNASTAVAETIAPLAAASNTSAIVINQGQNYINLTPTSAAGGAITLTAGPRTGTGVDFGNAASGTVLITARRLGLDAVGTAGSTNIILGTGFATSSLAAVGQNSNTAGGGSGVSKAVTPWAIVDDGTNVNFAVNDSAAKGIRALGAIAGEYVAGNTNALVANNNTLITANTTTAANATVSINSLKITGNTLTLQQGTTLNIQSGGILATANSAISGPGIISVDGTPNASTTGGPQNLHIWTHGSGTTLTLDSTLGFTNNNSGRLGEVVKAGAGNLILGGANFYTTNTRIQEGTLTLNNDLAIYYRQTMPASTSNLNSSNAGPTLQINQGGTLDMNNRDLTVNNFNSINPAGNQGSLSGGTVVNGVAGTKNFVINTTANNTWSGNISNGTGAINFARYGQQTFTITNENTYTGTTLIGGGATTLVDVGALRSTSGVTINAAALIWTDNGSQLDAYRLGAAPADVTFNGGGFQYNGRQGGFTVANLGDVTLASGANQFSTNAALYGNATIQMATFTRNAGAVVNFAGSVLGDDGFVKVSGTAPTNFNGIVGGWATTSATNPYVTTGNAGTGTGDFVEYDPATGFRAIVDYKTTAAIDYSNSGLDRPAYGNTAFGVNNNVRVNSNITLLAGNNVANSMVLGTTATTTLTFAAATDTLFIQSGGVLGNAANDKLIGASVAGGGKLTAGNTDGSAGLGNPTYDLYLHNLSSTMTVNAQIVNNGANAVNLITSTGSQNGPIIRLANTNTYTGTTIVNSTDLRLASIVGASIANSTSISIVGGNSGAADSSPQAMSRIFFENAGSQLNSGATVNVINNATLDTNNFNQTLANVIFNNTGGHTSTNSGLGGSVRTGSGILTLTGSITATNLTNISTIPFIAGNLNLNGGQRTITVDPVTGAGVQGAAQVGLSILANMSNGGIEKNGTGVLAITGINTYSGATNVNNGTLVLAGRDQASPGVALTANIGASQVTVAGIATVDLRGGNAIIGSLNGAGTVTNSVYGTTSSATGMPATLTVGADNTSTGNFSGRFTNFINGINETSGYALNVTKIGSGTQTISGDNAVPLSPTGSNGDINNVGTLDIQEGTILVNGASGSLGFTAINVKAGGTLILDNSTDNKVNRLGGFRLTDSANGDTANDTTTARTISLQGGTIVFKEGASLINEGTSGALSMAANPGAGSVTLTSGFSTLLFDATGGTAGATVNFNTITAGAGSLFINVGAGQTLGRAAAGATSINVYVNNGMTGQGTGPLSAPGTAVATAAGVQGNIVGGIRADITALDSTGTGFVTYDKFGYRLLESDEYSAFPTQPTGPNWAAVNPTITPTYTGNALVNTAQTWTTNTTILSLRLDSGGGLTSAGGAIPQVNSPVQSFNALGTLNTLTVTSGSIIGNTGNLGLTSGAISAGANAIRITAAADMNVSAYLLSTGVATAFIKDGSGILDLTKNAYLGSSIDSGATVVNGGTLLLNSGAANTIAAVSTATVAAVDTLTVNAGATVNLMGQDQAIGALASADTLPGGGGIITSTGAANLFIINPNNATATFGGSINGAINLYASKVQGANNSNQILTSANGYTGTTNVVAGTLILRDSGKLTATTAVNLNQGTLSLDNTALSADADRVADAATINMRGGSFLLSGRAGISHTETIGEVNLLMGNNTIGAAAGSNNGATTLNTGALTRTVGANVNFTNNGAGTLGGTSAAVQGANPRIFIAGQATGLIGGWAVANGTNFAYYDSVLGVGEFSNTASGFPTYSSTNISTSTATDTVNDGTTRTVTTNMSALHWRIAPNAANTVTLGTASGAGNSLTLAGGGLLVNNNNTFVIDEAATQLTRSTITSGTSELDIFINQNTTTLGLQVVGAISVVKGGGGTLTLTPKASNTYSGTTYVNGGTVNLSAGAGIAVVPDDLVINNATVTMNTNAGQIAATSDVTLMGSGTLNLTGAANTLQSLTFNNNGGNSAPLVANATASSILNIGGGVISAVGDNPGSTASITVPFLNFGTATPGINVTSNIPNKVTADLNIGSVIANDVVNWLAGTGSALAKTGTGNLVLSGANTFNNGFNLDVGTVTVGNAAAFGTGTLAIAGGTTIQADSTARTITNAININGDFTFGGQQAGNSITQTTGAVSLGGAVRNITVTSPQVTATLGGVIANGGLTKSGDGILTLNGANTYAGGTIINGGLVNAGNASALGANTNDLTVKAGATLNMNGNSLTIDGLNGDDAVSGGLITNTGAISTLTLGNNNEVTATFSGVITNTVNAIRVTKIGTGTQVFAGANTYTGLTTVTAGVLLANNATGSATGSGAIQVDPTGTLGGTGNVTTTGLTVAAGGTLRPGDPATAGGVGTLSVTGNTTLALTGGSVLELQITHNNGVSGGLYLDGLGNADWAGILIASETSGASDHLNITGALNINTSGVTTVVISAADLGMFAGGMAWDLVDWGSVSSTNAALYNIVADANLTLELASAGMSLDTSRFSTNGYIAIVPEPSRMLLLMFGLMALFFRRRRTPVPLGF